MCNYLNRYLLENGYKSEYMNGDMNQLMRDDIFQRYRENEYNILIGTDIVSGGLDIKDVKLVINMDLP